MSLFKIQQVEVEHFRGFRDKLTFDLSKGANLTVLAGPNGLGKSSFFDAIEWALTGKLFRYEEGDEEKRQTVFISHLPCDDASTKEPASVTLTFGDGQEVYRLMRRVRVNPGEPDYGDAKTAVILRGPDAIWEDRDATDQLNSLLINEPWQGKLRLQDIFNHYHFLTQDRLDNFVRGSKGPERYKQISQLFGNQRYLKYGKLFDDLLHKEEKKGDELNTEVGLLEAEVASLEQLTRAEDSVNLGSHPSLPAYIGALMSELAGLMQPHNLALASLDANASDELELAQASKTLIGKVIDAFHQRLSQAERAVQQWSNLDRRKNQYLSNLQERAGLEAEEAELRKWQDFEKIRLDLPQYAQFQTRIAHLQKEIKANLQEYDAQSKRKQEMSEEFGRWRRLVNSLREKEIVSNSPLANLTSKDSVNLTIQDSVNPTSKASFDASLPFSSANPLFNSENHETLIRDTEGIIKLLHEYNWHPVVAETVNLLKIRLPKIKEMQLTWESSNQELTSLAAELAVIVEGENELHDLLIKAFDYIQPRHSGGRVGGESCPVCGAIYDDGELLERVKLRIAAGNPLIKLKTDKKVELVKYINALIVFFGEERTKVTTIVLHLINMILGQMDNLANDIEIAELAMGNLILSNRACEEKITAVKSQQETTVNLIKQYNLPLSTRDLETVLDTQAPSALNPFVYRMNPDFINQSTESGISPNKLEKEIAQYETDLAEANLTREDLDVITLKLKEETDRLTAYLQIYDKAKFIETRLVEISQSLERSENYRNLQKVRQELAQKAAELRKVAHAVEKLEALKTGVRKAIEQMNQRVLDEQADLINKLFRRIYPHPFYRNLNLKFAENNHGTKILTLECQDEHGTKSINPIWTFSTAQINVIAVSIFLAMALQQQCTRLATILMDDPIQSMDDINIISFIDILRSCSDKSQNEFQEKQIILSTHDDKIYRLMMNKFRFLSAKSFTFSGYTERGPILEAR